MSTKQLSAGHLHHLADYMYSTRYVLLPPDIKIDDIFKPAFWAHHAARLKLHDIIRVRAEDGSFDFMITVIRKDQSAVLMDVWPKYPAAASVAEGGEAMAAIAVTARKELTQATHLGKPVPRVEYTRATKHRVIDLAGKEHSSGYATEADAKAALDKYLQGLGIESVKAPVEAK